MERNNTVYLEERKKTVIPDHTRWVDGVGGLAAIDLLQLQTGTKWKTVNRNGALTWTYFKKITLTGKRGRINIRRNEQYQLTENNDLFSLYSFLVLLSPFLFPIFNNWILSSYILPIWAIFQNIQTSLPVLLTSICVCKCVYMYMHACACVCVHACVCFDQKLKISSLPTK